MQNYGISEMRIQHSPYGPNKRSTHEELVYSDSAGNEYKNSIDNFRENFEGGVLSGLSKTDIREYAQNANLQES